MTTNTQHTPGPKPIQYGYAEHGRFYVMAKYKLMVAGAPFAAGTLLGRTVRGGSSYGTAYSFKSREAAMKFMDGYAERGWHTRWAVVDGIHARGMAIDFMRAAQVEEVV